MNSAENTQIRFADKVIDNRFKHEFGGLAETILRVSNDHAKNTIGTSFVANPSIVELTPHVQTSDDLQKISVDYVLTAWHETNTPGKVGILQRHNTVVTSVVHGEEGYLHDKDLRSNYLLTTREALLLESIASTAIIHSAFPQSHKE